MKLKSIDIKNYRSIETISFSISEINESDTFTLLGINESGKSSFLKAISIHDYKDATTISFPRDYFDRSKPIEVTFNYDFKQADFNYLVATLTEMGWPSQAIELLGINSISITTLIEPVITPKLIRTETISFKNDILNQFTLAGSTPALVDPTSETNQARLNLPDYFKTNEDLSDYFWRQSHISVLWKSDAKHLISSGINIEEFAKEPEKISIPLLNCFLLAGYKQNEIKDILQTVKADSAEASNLQHRLSDSVTSHLKNIWPKHRVLIKFQITTDEIQFLIEDEGVKYAAKLTEQRSDGFKQFLSFLLTVSAEAATKNLQNQLLLLDEPETHLHPQAQEELLSELINLAKSRNNIVIFATHSNYMIDKEHLERCFKVIKQDNKITRLEKIEPKASSYSEVNYEIFDISSTDYHNELYGYLENISKQKITELPKSKKWIDSRNNYSKDVSLAEYIRHSIHHPENTLNTKYTKNELDESIKILRSLR